VIFFITCVDPGTPVTSVNWTLEINLKNHRKVSHMV